MPSVPTIDDLKMLIAVLSQFAPDNKSFPSPNHIKLAEDLGLRDRKASQSQWFRLVKRMKTGEFGDFGDLILERDESPTKKRAVVEVPVGEAMNEAGSSPTKKLKSVSIASKAGDES